MINFKNEIYDFKSNFPFIAKVQLILYFVMYVNDILGGVRNFCRQPIVGLIGYLDLYTSILHILGTTDDKEM